MPSDAPNNDLWGYLQPCNPALMRIDFSRSTLKYNIGRNSEANEVVLPAPSISNSHCTIEWDGVEGSDGGVLVTDLSSNGTFIDGTKIGRLKSRILRNGDTVAFGISQPPPESDPVHDYRFIYRHLAAAGLPTSGIHAIYEVGVKLGQGGFASVYKALHRETGKYYAIKMIDVTNTVQHNGGEEERDDLQREISIMQQLVHHNICQLVETYFEEDGGVNLVLELVEGETLLDYILKTDSGLEEPSARDITYQICTALAFIHSNAITHRDMKLENVLLTQDQPPLVKIADFGLSKILDSQTMLRTMCGTPSYLAPKVISNNPEGYNNLVDSWGVGVIVFSMITLFSPFEDENNFGSTEDFVSNQSVQWSLLEDHNDRLSTSCKPFVQQLLENDPAARMSITHALKHEWLHVHIPFYIAGTNRLSENVRTNPYALSTSLQNNANTQGHQIHSEANSVDTTGVTGSSGLSMPQGLRLSARQSRC